MQDFKEKVGQRLTPELSREFKGKYKLIRVSVLGDGKTCRCNPNRLTIVIDKDRTIKNIFIG